MSSGLVLDTYDSIRCEDSEAFPIAPPTQPTEHFNPSKESVRPRSSKSLGRSRKPKKPERESLYYVDNGDKIDDLGIVLILSDFSGHRTGFLSDGGGGFGELLVGAEVVGYIIECIYVPQSQHLSVCCLFSLVTHIYFSS